MSSTNGDGGPELVTLEDVREQYNLIEQITQHVGVEDNLEAAILANLVKQIEVEQRQAELLTILTGQPVEVDAPLEVTVTNPLQVDPPDVEPQVEVVVESITPEVQFPDDASIDIEGIQIDQQKISDAFRDADSTILKKQLYNVSSSGSSDNILTQPLQPTSEDSWFRVSVTLDTATTFSVRVNPPDDSAFTEDLNQGGNLNQNAKREFQFDVDPDAEYNFRMGASGTVNNLTVREGFTE